MKLSVVTPTFNKRALLERTLAALRAQELPKGTGWEIVVVDDGSTDDTAAWLAAQAAVPGSPQLRVVSPGGNVGRARARNLGARAARGQWIVFIDDDIVARLVLIAIRWLARPCLGAPWLRLALLLFLTVLLTWIFLLILL